ncbi:sugar transferase [bacterium]|nr:sugar transferase [bacterium]
MTDLAPIILFVYNRPKHTETVLNALKKNSLAKDSILYVFSDAAKKEKDFENVNKVREIISKVSGFKEVVVTEAETNIGCADSITSGITKVINEHGKAIIVEDDILTAPNFLEFMNEALNRYESDKRIYSVSGFVPNEKMAEICKDFLFLAYRNSSWGWGTWADQWNDVDWDMLLWEKIKKDKNLWKKLQRGGEDAPYLLKLQMEGFIDSWAIRFYADNALKDKYTVFPTKTFVTNIGLDGSGTHCGNVKNNKSLFSENLPAVDFSFPGKLEFNNEINNLFASNYKYSLKDIIRRKIKNWLIILKRKG